MSVSESSSIRLSGIRNRNPGWSGVMRRKGAISSRLFVDALSTPPGTQPGGTFVQALSQRHRRLSLNRSGDIWLCERGF